MNKIETYPLNFESLAVPVSKYPVLVYRSIFKEIFCNDSTEKVKLENLDKVILENGWKSFATFPCITSTHYHPNVHELYAVISGHSKLILGLDVCAIPSEMNDDELAKHDHVEIDVNIGDAIVIPAGVSHCSRKYNKEYRYIGAYPLNGEKWISVNRSKVISSGGKEKYDFLKDTVMSQNIPKVYGDPFYGLQTNCLLDLWYNT